MSLLDRIVATETHTSLQLDLTDNLVGKSELKSCLLALFVCYDESMKVNYSPEKVAELFNECPEKYWIAGGWAIDLFLGEQTREHEDVDVAILRRDEFAFRSYLQDWEIWPGLGNDQLDEKPIALHEPLAAEREVLWCRPSTASEWAYELLLNRTIYEDWIFKRDESIRRPIDTLGLVSNNGIPYLRPEVVLLFKAKNNRDKDQQDFDNVILKLDDRSIEWLRNTLLVVHPNHAWLTALAKM